jgi:hypothetical protein
LTPEKTLAVTGKSESVSRRDEAPSTDLPILQDGQSKSDVKLQAADLATEDSDDPAILQVKKNSRKYDRNEDNPEDNPEDNTEIDSAAARVEEIDEKSANRMKDVALLLLLAGLIGFAVFVFMACCLSVGPSRPRGREEGKLVTSRSRRRAQRKSFEERRKGRGRVKDRSTSSCA